MVRPSYVSLQSALAFYGLIPDVVPATTGITTVRPGRWETPLGLFTFRHVQADLFFGYRQTDLGSGQQAFVATPEKALLDLVYLEPEGDTPAYLRELRLQNLERLDPQRSAGRCGPQRPSQAAAAPPISSSICVNPRRRSTRHYEGLPGRIDPRQSHPLLTRNVGTRIPAGTHPGNAATGRRHDPAGLPWWDGAALPVRQLPLFRRPGLRPRTAPGTLRFPRLLEGAPSPGPRPKAML